jgi:hypothetical protein
MSERRFLLAGFQVTTIGRFWVTAEGDPSSLFAFVRFDTVFKAMYTKIGVLTVAVLAVAFSGCRGKDLTRSRAQALIEAAPAKDLPVIGDALGIRLRLSKTQFDCGLHAGLWEELDGSIGNKLGAALHLIPGRTDTSSGYTYDATIYRTGSGLPVPVLVDEVTGITTPTGSTNSKLVIVRASTKIDHACFPNPVPFDSPLVFEFALFDDGWRIGSVHQP